METPGVAIPATAANGWPKDRKFRIETKNRTLNTRDAEYQRRRRLQQEQGLGQGIVVVELRSKCKQCRQKAG